VAGHVNEVRKPRKPLLQLLVLGLGLLKDGNLGVGVFPESEEIMICRFGFGGVAGEGVGVTDLTMSQ
jgi:hypothetical protein